MAKYSPICAPGWIAIVRHRVHHRIAEDDFAVVRCGRVVVEHGLDVRVKQPLDFGQCVEEFVSQSPGLPIYLSLGLDRVAVFAKLQTVGYLLGQLVEQLLHVDTDIVRADSLIRLPLVEIIGKDNRFHQPDYLLHLFH